MAGLAEIIKDPNYVSANTETKAAIFEKHAPNDPNYADANPETQAAIREKFGLTTGGAATGNPSIAAQGRKGLGLGFDMSAPAAIGGAAGLGGALGAMSKEILTGAGNVIGSFPQPAARSIGGFLKGAGQTIGTLGRSAPAAAGAISGAVGETAGQLTETTGAGPVAAETARFVGGAIGPEMANFAKFIGQKALMAPALSIASKIEKESIKAIVAKLQKYAGNETVSLAEQEAALLNKLLDDIRGPAGKTDEPLKNTGSFMGDEGKRLMDVADQQLIAAQARAAGSKLPPGAEMADVGGDLQNTINTRYKGALETRHKQFKANEEARDKIVDARVASGHTIDKQPEYAALLQSIEAELSPGKHTPDVQRGFQKIRDAIKSGASTPGDEKLVQSGLELNLFKQPDNPVPPSFKQIDEARRMLGESFGGKPPEGYEALKDKDIFQPYYFRLRELQKNYAGGKGGPQDRLLQDYEKSTEGLNIYSGKFGKKSTALDQYREETLATDPSSLPGAYFKTKASVQALKELTGNQAQVNNAALEFANKQLAGKDAAYVRKWLSDNSEWLAETGPTRNLIGNYATKLEAVERGIKNAQDIVTQVSKDTAFFRTHQMPAQRAVDLINSMDKAGGAKNWLVVAPAIAQSPQAKSQMVAAVRQVVADQATAKTTSDLFSRNIRPFLENSNIATKAEMDFIAQKLAAIQEMKVPEAEKLGIAKRILLQGAGGWAATAVARTGATTYGWTKEKVVPE